MHSLRFFLYRLYFNNSETTIICYKYNKPIRSTIFNFNKIVNDIDIYYIPINDTTLELSVFWPSDTGSRINKLRFSESISLSFKTRLTSVTCFCGYVT